MKRNFNKGRKSHKIKIRVYSTADTTTSESSSDDNDDYTLRSYLDRCSQLTQNSCVISQKQQSKSFKTAQSISSELKCNSTVQISTFVNASECDGNGKFVDNNFTTKHCNQPLSLHPYSANRHQSSTSLNSVSGSTSDDNSLDELRPDKFNLNESILPSCIDSFQQNATVGQTNSIIESSSSLLLSSKSNSITAIADNSQGLILNPYVINPFMISPVIVNNISVSNLSKPNVVNINSLSCSNFRTVSKCSPQRKNPRKGERSNEELQRLLQSKDEEIEYLQKQLRSDDELSVYPSQLKKQMLQVIELKNSEISSLRQELNDVYRIYSDLNNSYRIVAHDNIVQKRLRRSNINDFLRENPDFIKLKIEHGFQIYCSRCRDEMKTTSHSRFSKGITFKGIDAMYMEIGSVNHWPKFRDMLIDHLNIHKSPKIQNFSLMISNILTITLTAIKSKCNRVDFDNWLSVFKSFGIQLHDTVYNFAKILSEMRSYITKILQKHLSTPLKSTGLKPHFSVALDWLDSGSNGTAMKQIVFIIVTINGNRKSIPIDCQAITVSMENEDFDSNVIDQGNVLFQSLKSTLNLEDDDFNHITYLFTNNKCPNLYSFVKQRLHFSAEDDRYFFNLFNDSGWIDSNVKNVLQSSNFFNVFSERYRTFLSGALPNTKSKSSAFCLDLLKDLKLCLKQYEKSMVEIDDNKNYHNFINDKDFLLDICVLMDILSPISEVIGILQSANIAPWKVTIWLPKLLRILQEMEGNLKMCLSKGSPIHCHLFPILIRKWDEIVMEKQQSNGELSVLQFVRGKDNSIPWNMRTLKVCITDYVTICIRLRNQLELMYKTSVKTELKELRSCFDLSCMLDEIVDAEECLPIDRPKYMEHFFQSGLNDFENFFNFLVGKPQFTSVFNETSLLSASYTDIFRNWKELFYRVLFEQSHKIGTWFVNKSGKKISGFDDEIANIAFESDEGVTKTFYELRLKNGSVIGEVRFVEEELMKYLLSITDGSVDKSILAIVEYVFSLYLVETNFDTVRSLMRSHGENENDDVELVDRVIIDCLYPSPNQCTSTLKKIGKNLLMQGPGLFSNDVQTQISHQSNSVQESNVIRYPFIANSDFNDDSLIIL